MIKLNDYLVGVQPKGKEEMMLINHKRGKEDRYILLIPKSIVEDLKKGDIGEWE